ncbi:Mitochondrial ornithine transporter [Fasciola hepatica]|uniref:Mitochondrial ornithine transporter n=1 Tax=Fasciola hepatica TaxID=6192 RepID=A0A4E0RI34_FASHE|nr:Mitochondrial ornithine transporter [Fasciola hepatica]
MEHVKSSAIGLVAGINGGIATVYVGQPLDTIKVKMQAFPEVYPNAWNCFKVTLVKDGIARGLYAGTVPALVANVAENAVLFCALPPSQHAVCRLVGKERSEHLSNFEHACAGSLAAFWSSLALCPTELVKCKVQSLREMAELGQVKLKASEFGPWNVTKRIIREDGLMGFTRGLSATFAREMPGYFCFFGGYETCRSLLVGRDGRKDHLHPLATAFCGGMGGVMLWLAIFPFDVLKSRMQIGHLEAEPAHTSSVEPSVKQRQPGMIKLFCRIVKHEGVRSLYRGLGPTLLRTFPASGALFVAVEWTRTCGRWLLD